MQSSAARGAGHSNSEMLDGMSSLVGMHVVGNAPALTGSAKHPARGSAEAL